MCDQTEVSYLENDVVWVKIGPIWWPGVVKDLEKDEEGREILAGLKKKPIAAVKFFQEDNYEFVKNLDHIYHYNCRKKDEFIKKGLDKFRTGASHMKKFPADVTTAESLVNGDVNIINDPKFYPEKRQSYSEIFGSGKKKSKKESETPSRAKLNTSRSSSSSSSTPYRPITHQRFINKVLHGESDHKVRTLIQPTSSPDDLSKGLYRCHMCRFETVRVNVIVAHHRLAHSSNSSINWTGSETKTVKRKPVYKSRKPKSKKVPEFSRTDSSDDEYLDKKKIKIKGEKTKSPEKYKDKSVTRKGASVTPRKRKTNEDVAEDNQKKPRFTDVLLADWSEDDEDENKADQSRACEKDDDRENENSTENPTDTADLSGKSECGDSNRGKEDSKNQSEKMSCFDFDEEEEGFIGMSNANTYGRKIPRVIPMKDKTELGVDMEIGELFKRKNESDADTGKQSEGECTEDDGKTKKNAEEDSDKFYETEVKENVEEKTKENDKEGETGKIIRRRRKSSKDADIKVDEDSLAVRRTRRPGAKKSYLNEIIEKVEDNTNPVSVEEEEGDSGSKGSEVQNSSRKAGNDISVPSPSKRKQDLKLQAMGNSLEESVYSEIGSNDGKITESTTPPVKKPRGRPPQSKTLASDDLTRKVDHLLAETNVPSVPEIPDESKADAFKTFETPKPSKTMNFSFDYLSPDKESSDKTEKQKTEVKSITKMFSDTIKGSENVEDKDRSSSHTSGSISDVPVSKMDAEGKKNQSKNMLIGGVKILSSQGSSIQLAAGPSTVILDESGQRVNPGAEGSPSTATGASTDAEGSAGTVKEAGNLSDASEKTVKTKNIKALKLKTDSLPSGLLSPTGKLKGQTIIHQKGGTYVILSQPPQISLQKINTTKGQTPSKFVILTNQHGEQKIITTSGLQQSKFKIDPQKSVVVTPPGGTSASDGSAPSGIISVGKTQPVIKMVPDGKGGVVKHLTVSPKKVIVGGTKVLVSGAGATFSTQGNTIQKIALTGGNNLSGDYRLIENYKGSGKTLLIHGGSNTSSSVLLKTSSGVQRHVAGDTAQSTPNILGVKKKPKIFMTTTPTQNEYVVQTEVATVDSPTYVMKRKGADGKFSAQKIIRRPLVTPAKAKSPGSGQKTILLSSEQPLQKAESLIITTNHEPETNKIIRFTQKVWDSDLKPKFAHTIIHKGTEGFAMSENSILTSTEPEEQEMKGDTAQIVQVAQNQSQPSVLQTQVMAMPGPIGSDGNQTYVLVSVDEHGVVQPVDNSLIAYDTSGQSETVYMNENSNNNVIVINQQAEGDIKPVFSNGSQDILAEALANTNVLEGNMNNEIETVMPSILLPPSIPSSVVQETSITLQKPIMTPLEMPTSVTPDTSGLEPPPLPPTPTEEDVLMEDQDAEMQEVSCLREDELIAGENRKEQSLQKKQELTESNLSAKQSFKGGVAVDEELIQEKSETSYGESKEGKAEDQRQAGEQFVVENSQEEQGSSPLQSMPLLNDEPDTSDEAQSSEQTIDQDFDPQKSRSKPEALSPTLREQEPPSSTNNEVLESNYEKPKSESVTSCDAYHSALQETTGDEETRITESDKTQEDPKVKELVENGDMQSMPIINDDGNVNTYNFGQLYVDALSQKRFQEETEVTSTTDEFSNKDNIA